MAEARGAPAGARVTVAGRLISTSVPYSYGGNCACCGSFDAYVQVADPTTGDGLRLAGFATTGAGLRHRLACGRPVGEVVGPRFPRGTSFGTAPWHHLHQEPPPEHLRSEACCTIPTEGLEVRATGTLAAAAAPSADPLLTNPELCTPR